MKHFAPNFLFGKYLRIQNHRFVLLAWFLRYVIVMKIAIPNWQDRISPVFDVARKVLLVDIIDGQEQSRQNMPLEIDGLQERIETLIKLGTDVLVCGAISRPLEMSLTMRGVKVIPHMCGDIEQVLAAFIAGNLHQDKFSMPGCCRQRRRVRGGGQHWQNRQKGGDENVQR